MVTTDWEASLITDVHLTSKVRAIDNSKDIHLEFPQQVFVLANRQFQPTAAAERESGSTERKLTAPFPTPIVTHNTPHNTILTKRVPMSSATALPLVLPRIHTRHTNTNPLSSL